MSADALPHWRDTVELLKSKGFTDTQVTEAAENVRKTLGKAARTEDFVLWVVAQHLGVEVPRVSTLERKPRGDSKLITAKDVTREMAEEFKDSGQDFVLEGWILNPVEYATKDTPPKPRIKLAFVDTTGSTQITCFGDDACEHWRTHELDYPSFVRIEGLQVFPLGEDGVTLTHGKYAKCAKLEPPYTLDKALPDASEAYVSEGKLARVQGLVTDESRKNWERCSKCGKGKKNCKGHQGGQSYEPQEIHTVTVFDGNARHTLVMFDDLAPRRKIYGHPIDAVGVYKKKEKGPGEFEAIVVNVGNEPAFKPLPSTLKPTPQATSPAAARALAPAAPKGGDLSILAQTVQVLNVNLRPYRIKPKGDLDAALRESGFTDEQIIDQLGRACAQGIIRDAGDSYQWMGGEPIVGEPPASATAPPPARPSAPAAPPAPLVDSEARTRQRKIMGIIRKLDDGKGAPWEDVIKAGVGEGMSEETVEKTLDELFASSAAYEPVLGRLKPTE